MKIWGKSVLLNLLLWAGVILGIFFILAWLLAKAKLALGDFWSAWLGGKGTGPVTNAVAAVGNALDSTAGALGVNVKALPTLDTATQQRILYDTQRALFAKIYHLSVSNDYAMNAAGWPDIWSWKTNSVVIHGLPWGPSADTSKYAQVVLNG